MIPSTLLQGLYSEKLQGGLSSGNRRAHGASGFSDILGRMKTGPANNGKIAVSGETAAKGHSFLEQLKKGIMASGRSLEGSTVNEDAVAEFGDMLVKAGFGGEEVDGLLSNITFRSTGKGVTLAALFAGASQLSEPDGSDSMPVILGGSVLPELDSILSELGLGLEMRRRIFADALVEGSGIDLRALAAGIRRMLTAGGAASGATTGDLKDVVEKMKHIGLLEDSDEPVPPTLDGLISELSRVKDSASLSAEGGETDGLPGSLLISLRQFAGSLGDDGRQLRRLIASAGKDGGGDDGKALLSKLMQMKQGPASTVAVSGMTRASGVGAEASATGEMSLPRFVSILESRVAADDAVRGASSGTSSGRSMAEVMDGFLEKVSPAGDGISKNLIFPVDSDAEKTSKVSWQPAAKRMVNATASQAAGKPASGAGGKAGGGQHTPEISGQTAADRGTDRQFSDNLSGKDQPANFSDAMNAVGRDKATKPAVEVLMTPDGFVREMKSADEAASLGKTSVDRSLPGYLLNQVSRQIIRLRAAGESDITLQLKPPHLGRMKLNIEHTPGGIKVGIVVESAAAKEMLLAHTNDLKAALADQGLRLDKIDVETQTNFGQSTTQAGREFGKSGGRKNRWTGRPPAGVDGVPEASLLSGTDPQGMGSGRLDLVA